MTPFVNREAPLAYSSPPQRFSKIAPKAIQIGLKLKELKDKNIFQKAIDFPFFL